MIIAIIGNNHIHTDKIALMLAYLFEENLKDSNNILTLNDYTSWYTGLQRTFPAKFIEQIVVKQNTKWSIRRFNESVKHIVHTLTGRDVTNMTNGELKQTVPSEWTSQSYNDMIKFIQEKLFENQFCTYTWIISLFKAYDEHANWMITDFRHKYEIDYVIQHHKAITINLNDCNLNSQYDFGINGEKDEVIFEQLKKILPKLLIEITNYGRR